MSKEKAAAASNLPARRGMAMPGAKATPKGKAKAKAPGNVYNEVKLNPRSPIPFEDAGQSWTAADGNAYTPFIGRDDNFAAALLEARLLSPTQSACITTKRRYLLGNGVTITNLGEGQVMPPEWLAISACANGRRQTFNKVMERNIENFLTFGNGPIEVVRGKVAGKKFVYLYAKNFLDCKLGKVDEKTGDIEYALVSTRFRAGSVLRVDDKVKQIPLYKAGRADDSQNWLKDGRVERTMIWLKNEVAGYDTYGLPSSVASLLWQLTEYSGGRFNLDSLENNMILGAAIFLTGGVTQAEADTIAASIVRRHTGHGRRGRTGVFASENGINDVKVVQMETHKEGSYLEQDANAVQKILMANEWDAVLAGLNADDALGKGAGYLEERYKQILQSIIIPAQRRMIEELMPSLVEIYRIWGVGDFSGRAFAFDPIQLDTKTSEVATTVAGLDRFLDIIDMVASGQLEYAAAVRIVMRWYGRSEKEAKEELGTIKITNRSVRTKSNGQGGANNPAGDPTQNGGQQ